MSRFPVSVPLRTAAVRALPVNRFASQSAARVRHLVAVADSTEVNALVIDMTDEFGLDYASGNPTFARNAGGDAALGTAGREHVRPWRQAFALGKPDHTAEEVRRQRQAVSDAGDDGRVLWHPGSKFEPYEAALERGALVSNRGAQQTAAPEDLE